MGKKQRKASSQVQQVMPPGGVSSACPLCGTTNVEHPDFAAMDTLLQSNVELSSLLRQVGRRLSRLMQQDSQLDNVRRALNRAETVRRMLRLPGIWQEDLKTEEPDPLPLPRLEPEYVSEPAIPNYSVREGLPKRRLARPRALRIVAPPRA